MSFSHRQGRPTTRFRLEELERRDVPTVLVPTTFANAGISFNSATRTVEGGLYSLAVQESNQPISTVARYQEFLTDVRDTINAERAAGGDLSNVSDATADHLDTIVADLTTAINNAPDSILGGDASTAVHHAQIQILNVVNDDPFLKNLASMTVSLNYTGVGFQQVPQKLPAGVTAANAPHDNLAQIGAIENDAANRFIGGVGNADNKAAIIADLTAVRADLGVLVDNHPELFGGLTGIHARTIIVQIPGVFGFINDIGVNPVANRGNNDIMLDLPDIVQGDVNLANQADQGGANGFGLFPAPRTAPTRYQLNQDQTNAIAFEIAQGNTLGVQAIALVTNHPGDTAAINALIQQFKDLSQFANNFDTAQGGIFEARFDNEQKSDTGTQRAAINAMIRGLRTGDVALVTAAREAISANWADNAGNMIPATGGTFNTDGLTIAQVLSTAHP
jgi:hypothetical protein